MLIDKVIQEFEKNELLKIYIPYLKTSLISDVTLENFLELDIDYIQRYFFWVMEE